MANHRFASIHARAVLAPALLALGLLAAAPAWPFGEYGHQLVGALAEDMLTPKARAQVQALLAPGGAPTLAAASTWADEIRTLRPASRPWHYITLQIDDPHPDPARSDTPNVATALARELAVLSAPGADSYAREEALKWVVHLAGDLHQPLHAGERRDKGGNLMQVKLNRRTYALHAVWDYVLLERLHLPLDSAKAMLEAEIAADPGWIPRNAQGTPAQWALETHGLSAACYLLHGKPMPAGKKVQLDREYARAATLTSLSQIKRAGTRLAFLLNRAFDPGSGLPVLRNPARQAPHGGGSGPSGWFAHADTVREDAGEDAGEEERATPKGPHAQAAPAHKSNRGKAALARYAWSGNSQVYHYSECADVKRIHKRNLETADIPPPDKALHEGCPRP